MVNLIQEFCVAPRCLYSVCNSQEHLGADCFLNTLPVWYRLFVKVFWDLSEVVGFMRLEKRNLVRDG